MGAADKIRLNEDGQYVLVDEEELAKKSEQDSESASSGGEASSPTDEADSTAGSAGEGSRRHRQNLTSISSSISGPGIIGEDVAAKRANLLHAQGKPQRGRREPPEPYDPRPRRIMYAKGLLAGLLVVIIAIVIVLFVGAESTIG